GRAELRRMPGGDDRAERVAEEREPFEPERLREQVDVAREHVERERGRVDTLAAALSPLVDVEEPELVSERIEPRPEHRVVHPRSAVEDDQREALAELLDEDPVPVRERDSHRRNLS